MQPNVAYSGADDCALKGWDYRQPSIPTFVNRKGHTAGVCCVESHPSEPHLLATGSYDEVARLWDTRSMAQPVQRCQVRQNTHALLSPMLLPSELVLHALVPGCAQLVMFV